MQPSPSLYLLVADNFYRTNRLLAAPHPLQSHYYVNKFTLGDSLDKQKYISFIKSLVCLVYLTNVGILAFVSYDKIIISNYK